MHLQKLPILFLLNGANVRAQDYSDYITLMVQRGYTFVASDYWHFIPGALLGIFFPWSTVRLYCRGFLPFSSSAYVP